MISFEHHNQFYRVRLSRDRTVMIARCGWC